VKILVDMNLSARWVDVLGEAGIAASHWSAIDPANAPDRALFEYAADHDFVILTHDLDFGTILAVSGSAKPSVIQIRGLDLRPEKASHRLLAVLWQTTADLIAGALVTLDTQGARIKVLPLQRNPR
jgi:predicted nuclease of predicted toxin-antitoxin system